MTRLLLIQKLFKSLLIQKLLKSLLIRKLLKSYSVIDLQNSIFSALYTKSADEYKFFEFMNYEIEHPSIDAINITSRLNRFILATKLVIFFFLLFVFIFGVTNWLLASGFIIVLCLRFYQYDLDEKIYNLKEHWLSKLQ